MEDQQSASGDLTQKSVANGESTDTASAATEGHRGEIDAAGEPDERGAAVADSQADEDDSAATAARGGKTRARRSRGRRLAITVGVAAALFVGSAAFAGATVEPYLSERAVVATKLMVADRRQCDHDVVDLHAGEHGHPGRSGRELPQR